MYLDSESDCSDGDTAVHHPIQGTNKFCLIKCRESDEYPDDDTAQIAERPEPRGIYRHYGESKGDRDFSDWLERVEAGKVNNLTDKADYFKTHRIPSDEAQHEYPQFKRFLLGESGRTQIIREELKQTLPLNSSA